LILTSWYCPTPVALFAGREFHLIGAEYGAKPQGLKEDSEKHSTTPDSHIDPGSWIVYRFEEASHKAPSGATRPWGGGAEVLHRHDRSGQSG